MNTESAQTVAPTTSFRWLVRNDGEKILQQGVWGSRGFEWRDVPTTLEYELPLYEQSHTGDHP